MRRICGNCALKAIQGGVCPYFNQAFDGEEAGCPMFTTKVEHCDICGSYLVHGGVIQEDEDCIHLICEQCAVAPPCGTCVCKGECGFQTDRSCTEPHMVNVRQQQGNMVVQTQIKNPKRIEATCKKSCPCWFDEIGCIKDFGTGCLQYKTNWRE